jgi:hypothetical protein
MFSNGCKWTKHIDKLIEKYSKHLNVLRNLNLNLKEKILKKFIRPILEYASEIWFQLGHFNSYRLEKVPTEAVRIVCGLPCDCYSKIAPIYKETG